ncbi:MAG: hypothetical protein ACRD2A_11285, partial [Vicinamibacterales bacterium]
ERAGLVVRHRRLHEIEEVESGFAKPFLIELARAELDCLVAFNAHFGEKLLSAIRLSCGIHTPGYRCAGRRGCSRVLSRRGGAEQNQYEPDKSSHNRKERVALRTVKTGCCSKGGTAD